MSGTAFDADGYIIASGKRRGSLTPSIDPHTERQQWTTPDKSLLRMLVFPNVNTSADAYRQPQLSSKYITVRITRGSRDFALVPRVVMAVPRCLTAAPDSGNVALEEKCKRMCHEEPIFPESAARQIVALEVAGSSPVGHPPFNKEMPWRLISAGFRASDVLSAMYVAPMTCPATTS